MKGLKKNAAIISQIIGLMFLTTIGASARPIGGWSHNSHGKSIPMDSPLGIGILVGVGVFLLLIFLLVIRRMRKRMK